MLGGSAGQKRTTSAFFSAPLASKSFAATLAPSIDTSQTVGFRDQPLLRVPVLQPRVWAIGRGRGQRRAQSNGFERPADRPT